MLFAGEQIVKQDSTIEICSSHSGVWRRYPGKLRRRFKWGTVSIIRAKVAVQAQENEPL
jgi:hypothetical protein